MPTHCRMVTLFAEEDDVAQVRYFIDARLLPSLSEVPGFLGMVVLESDRARRTEFVGLSFWEGELEASEEVSEQMREGVQSVIGTVPSRKGFQVVRAMVRPGVGQPFFEWSA